MPSKTKYRMNSKRNLWHNLTTMVVVLLTAATIVGCTDHDLDDDGQKDEPGTIYRTVAVFSTRADSASKASMGQWLIEEVRKANRSSSLKVNLKVNWTCVDDPDWVLDIERAMLDTLTDVIIAPSHASYAKECMAAVANISSKGKKTIKPVIYPQTTAVDVQRLGSAYSYARFLSESDMTQAEMLVSVCDSFKFSTIHAISTDDDYGQSFSDKLPFIVDEWDYDMGRNVSISANATRQDIEAAMQQLCTDRSLSDTEGIIFSSSNLEHYRVADSICDAWNLNSDGKLHLLFPDLSADVNEWIYKDAAGVMLAPSSFYGFAEAFVNRYHYSYADGLPISGEAHDYDAFLMAYLTIRMSQRQGITPNEALQKLTGSYTGTECRWNAEGIAAANNAIDAGQPLCVYGASGSYLYFNGKQNATSFYLWICKDQTPQVVDHFCSLDVTMRTDPNKPVEDWTPDDPESEGTTHSKEHPRDTIPLDERWAIIVATSQGWNNYRHDADALAMYQMLKRHGYDDRHILLVINDDLAQNARNAYPGKVFIENGGQDVYENAVIDYRTSEITPQQLFQATLTSNDFAPDSDDNVFVYWVGHGAKNGNLLWLNQSGNAVTPQAFNQWVGQLNSAGRYRKMLVCIEACYSGAVAKALTQDAVLCMSAADDDEMSVVHGDEKDEILGTYLSDEFSYQLINYADNFSGTSLSGSYKYLYTSIPTSHVTLSKTSLFGCLVHTELDDFFPY